MNKIKNPSAVALGRLAAESNKKTKDAAYWKKWSDSGVKARKDKKDAKLCLGAQVAIMAKTSQEFARGVVDKSKENVVSLENSGT